MCGEGVFCVWGGCVLCVVRVCSMWGEGVFYVW